MKIKYIIPVLVLAFSFTACKEENAAAKVKQANLTTAMTRDAEIKKGAPELSIDENTYDFGTVKEGDIIETTFVIKNTGKSDLIITDAKPSCGCTVPEWPRTPIKPGTDANIKVKFNTNGKPNRQVKSVTLYTNTTKGREVLQLKGMVTPKDKS